MEKTIKCLYCSKEFTTSANAAKYCSVKCRRKASMPPKIYKRHLTCAYCGESFDSERVKRYCSEDCRLRANGRCAPQKKKKKTAPKLSLEDAVRLSREAGMTYGKYIQANNL